jgi:hypothetical protein
MAINDTDLENSRSTFASVFMSAGKKEKARRDAERDAERDPGVHIKRLAQIVMILSGPQLSEQKFDPEFVKGLRSESESIKSKLDQLIAQGVPVDATAYSSLVSDIRNAADAKITSLTQGNIKIQGANGAETAAINPNDEHQDPEAHEHKHHHDHKEKHKKNKDAIASLDKEYVKYSKMSDKDLLALDPDELENARVKNAANMLIIDAAANEAEALARRNYEAAMLAAKEIPELAKFDNLGDMMKHLKHIQENEPEKFKDPKIQKVYNYVSNADYFSKDAAAMREEQAERMAFEQRTGKLTGKGLGENKIIAEVQNIAKVNQKVNDGLVEKASSNVGKMLAEIKVVDEVTAAEVEGKVAEVSKNINQDIILDEKTTKLIEVIERTSKVPFNGNLTEYINLLAEKPELLENKAVMFGLNKLKEINKELRREDVLEKSTEIDRKPEASINKESNAAIDKEKTGKSDDQTSKETSDPKEKKFPPEAEEVKNKMDKIKKDAFDKKPEQSGQSPRLPSSPTQSMSR